MKRTLFAAGLFAVLASTSFGQTMVANIPFNFEMVKTQMPAGKYLFTQNNSVVVVRSAEGKATAIALGLPASRYSERSTPSVEFQVYGREHFLTNLWMDDSQTGFSLPKGKRQKELARNINTVKAEEVALGSTTKNPSSLQSKNTVPTNVQ